MWKCLYCETLNNGDFCVVCGQKRPTETDSTPITQNTQQNNQSFSEQTFISDSTYREPGYHKEKKSRTLIVICVILALLLAVAVFTIAALYMDSNKEPSSSMDSAKKNLSMSVAEPTVKPTIKPTEELKVELTAKPTAEPTITPTAKPTSVPTSDDYRVYNNSEYNFYCAYPSSFHPVTPEGVNAVKTFKSADNTAVMTIRACCNSSNITTNEAMRDFHNAYGGVVTYKAAGDTWYATSIEDGGTSHYRKCFVEDDIICCFDFVFNGSDLDIYSPYIEYIEDNFRIIR